MTTRLAATVIAAWLPAVAASQGTPIDVPKLPVLPNYDSVFPGKDQALESGAFIARARDASANFYNPAGLVQSEKFSLNASSTGWVLTRLTSVQNNDTVTSGRIDNVPGFVGVVIGAPLIGIRNLRLGFSLTRPVAWAPGGIDNSATISTAQGPDRITYSSQTNFRTLLYQVAVAWAPVSDRSLRLGASFGPANTVYDASQSLSGLVTTGGHSGQFLSSIRANGSEWDMVLGAGVQWDLSPGLTVGALLRSRGIRLASSSLVTYESAVTSAQSPTSTFFRDDAGRFEYRLPLEVGVGVAYRFGRAQIEADLRFHEATGSYDFYRSSVPLQVTTHNPDGSSSASTQPPPVFTYSARRVINASLGGNVPIGSITTLHGGFHTALSPVTDAATSSFRKADLYGFSGGIDFQFTHFGFSLGADYEFGTSPATTLTIGGESIQGGSIQLQTLSILYAFTYSF